MAAEALESYLGGQWSRGQGVETELTDPTNCTVLATASGKGLDLAGALAFARSRGGPALRMLTYAERAKLLGAVAEALGANRVPMARSPSPTPATPRPTPPSTSTAASARCNTMRARRGAGRREHAARRRAAAGKDETFQAMHVGVPLRGVAVHINAFNFPAWGLWEKAAVALLSGVPVLAKPATATCWLAQRMVEDVVEAGACPTARSSIVCGGAGDLLDHVTGQDAIAFTGSAETAQRIPAIPTCRIAARG